MTSVEQVDAAVATIRPFLSATPVAAVVLGSGFSALTERLEHATSIPYADVPGWPAASTIGHEGRLAAGSLAGRPVMMLAGRAHAYEGHDLQAVTFGIRVLGRLGVPAVILTNAAGGIREDLVPGSLVVVDDHLNMTGRNPLVGPNDDRFGPRFPDMTEAYSPRLRAAADAAARATGIEMRHGVYAWVTGPSYETPAEIRWLRSAGADIVGMSTVPEAIVARHMGLDVLAISCVTNLAAGRHPGALSHADVIAVAGRARERLGSVLAAVVERL